jgi:SAM-dependent methyltransferase
MTTTPIALRPGRPQEVTGPDGRTAHLACRFCRAPLSAPLVDLGTSPLANSYVRAEDLVAGEVHYPLSIYVCGTCHLVQLPSYEAPEEIFGDYAYFSSYSASWLDHARAYVEMMTARFAIDERTRVVEVASNDGYLLRFFRERGVPVLGVEPAANVAEAAREAGIPTVVRFFGVETARALREEGGSADVMVANNVIAHVPDLNDFVAGFRELLAPEGVATIEFADLLRMIEKTEFDTVYHEHFTYFSLLTVERVCRAHGLRIFDVEELPTHGGSLRVFVCHDAAGHEESGRLRFLREREADWRLDDMETYARFERQVRRVKLDLLRFLLKARREGETVAAYGAPAKGNTLLNYCGVRSDLIEYTVDRNPVKQGTFLPGSRIPVYAPERLAETRPDYVLILAWNLKDEIMGQMAHVRRWGGRFATPIPRLEIHP